MNIYDELSVLGGSVRDSAGRRLERNVALDYASTGTPEAWYLLRLTGWRRALLVVPGDSAHCGDRHGVDRSELRVMAGRA